MTPAIKLALGGGLASLLLVPLGLIGLTIGAVAQAEASCQVAAATNAPTPSTDDTDIVNVAAPNPTSSDPATGVSCDGGDGLADGEGGGIPDGFVFPSNAQQAIAVSFALAQLGKPYKLGAAGPDAYDCSGLVMKAWAAAGVSIPRTTKYQVNTGVAVPSIAAMQPGDLILIPGSDGTMAHPGHVGMYIGRDNTGRQWLVQAPHTGTVVRTTLVSAWADEIAAIRRPLTHGLQDLIRSCAVSPDLPPKSRLRQIGETGLRRVIDHLPSNGITIDG